MDKIKIEASIASIKDDLARAIERGDRGQAAACRTNLAAFAAMRKRAAAPKPACGHDHPMFVAEVLDDGRGTRFGREVQTDKGPVVAVPDSVKKGDSIKAQYRCGPNYGLNFFIAEAR